MSFLPQQLPGGPGADPGALLAALAGGGGPPGGPPDGGPPPDQAAPEDALRQAIQDLHALETLLPDAQDTADVKQCGLILAKIQAKMHAARSQAGTAGQALVQRLGAGGGGPGA